MRKASHNRSNRYIASRSQRRIIRVMSEGYITEPEYLRRLAKSNSNVVLKIVKSGKSPDTLVREAQKLYRSTNRIRSSDQVWCIFDVDDVSDQSIKEIRARASTNDIKTATSNPCFELWLVLHKKDQTAYIKSSKVQKRAETLGLVKGKKVAAAGWSCLSDNYEAAKKRAQALDSMHQRIGSSPGSNPSTDVWRLVDVLRS